MLVLIEFLMIGLLAQAQSQGPQQPAAGITSAVGTILLARSTNHAALWLAATAAGGLATGLLVPISSVSYFGLVIGCTLVVPVLQAAAILLLRRHA